MHCFAHGNKATLVSSGEDSDQEPDRMEAAYPEEFEPNLVRPLAIFVATY